MKKSPLSTPGNSSFHRGRGQRRGYGYKQSRNDNDNYRRFTGFNNSPNNMSEGDMIPLCTSSPKFNHNRVDQQQSSDFRNQRFSSTGISGSYNQVNQVNNYQNNPHGRGRKKYQWHQQNSNKQNNWRQDNEQTSYRKLPISEFFDMKSSSRNPWIELERLLGMEKSDPLKTATNDSSIEIISEQIGNVGNADSSPDYSSDEGTINITSSCDENKQGSSVELPLESMNFSQNSSDVVLLSDDLNSQSDSSLKKSGN